MFFPAPCAMPRAMDKKDWCGMGGCLGVIGNEFKRHFTSPFMLFKTMQGTKKSSCALNGFQVAIGEHETGLVCFPERRHHGILIFIISIKIIKHHRI
jgi:hypothetical protein